MDHHLSHARNLWWGDAHYNRAGAARRGAPFTPLTLLDLGTPVIGDVDALVKAATSTELPDTETVTYTFPAAAVSPTDGVLSATGILDVPRNIVVQTTHATSIVAMTIVVTGTDVYGEPLVEQIAVAATGTDETDAGKKAFKTVTSIAITAAGDAEANTCNIGFGDVLGLPYRVDAGGILQWIEDNLPHVGTLGTFVAAVTSAATATTGDVRGTVDPNTTLDGTKNYRLLVALDPTSKTTLFGVAQYGG